MQISQRFHNDTYAPGIATYGIQGKDGEQGTPGTSLFFSEFSFPGEYLDFAKTITSRLLPLKNKQIQLNRKYVNGDQFVDPNGNIYLLNDINQLIIDSKNNQVTLNDNDTKLVHIGKFNEETQNTIFSDTNTGTLRANKFIISDSSIETGAGILSVIKSVDNDNNDINFINLESLYNGQHDMNLDIKYSKKYNGFMLSSKYPIYLNANVYTKFNTSATANNEYSPIYTANNNEKNITDYISTTKDLRCNVDASIYNYTYKDSSTIYYGVIYKLSFNFENNSKNTTWDDFIKTYDTGNTIIHFQNKEYSDFTNVIGNITNYSFRQDYNYVKLNDLINKVKYTDLPHIVVSIINGIEAYVTVNDRNISGLKKNN